MRRFVRRLSGKSRKTDANRRYKSKKSSEVIMNKSEFIRAYADNLGVTIKDAEHNFQTFVDTLTQVLQTGKYVHVSGFATFEIKEKNARDGINPKTGEKLTIEACKSPTAKFSKAYKDLFN